MNTVVKFAILRTEYLHPQQNPSNPVSTPCSQRITEALKSCDTQQIAIEVARLRLFNKTPVADDYKIAIKALAQFRQKCQPITDILGTYLDMIDYGFLPDTHTNASVIVALCERDMEVAKEIDHVSWKMKWTAYRTNAQIKEWIGKLEQKQLELRNERNFLAAMLLFNEMFSRGDEIPGHLYYRLLRGCSDNASITHALQLFEQLEMTPYVRRSTVHYSWYLNTFVNARNLRGTQQAFINFLEDSQKGILEAEHNQDTRRSHILIWVNMIRSCFICKDYIKAVELFEVMLNTTADQDFVVMEIPPHCVVIYGTIIKGFILAGEVQTGLVWFDKLLEQDTPAPSDTLEPLLSPVRPHQNTWEMLFEAFASRNMANELAIYADKYTELLSRGTDDLDVRLLDRFKLR